MDVFPLMTNPQLAQSTTLHRSCPERLRGGRVLTRPSTSKARASGQRIQGIWTRWLCRV